MDQGTSLSGAHCLDPVALLQKVTDALLRVQDVIREEDAQCSNCQGRTRSSRAIHDAIGEVSSLMKSQSLSSQPIASSNIARSTPSPGPANGESSPTHLMSPIPSPNDNNNLIKANLNQSKTFSDFEDQIQSPDAVLSSGSESECEFKVNSPTAADAADAAADNEEDDNRESKFKVSKANSTILSDLEPPSLSLTLNASYAEAELLSSTLSSSSPCHFPAINDSSAANANNDANAAESDDDIEILDYNPGTKTSQSIEFKPAVPSTSGEDAVTVKRERIDETYDVHLLRDSNEVAWGDRPRDASLKSESVHDEVPNSTDGATLLPHNDDGASDVSTSRKVNGAISAAAEVESAPSLSAVRVKSEIILEEDNSDVNSLNNSLNNSSVAGFNSTIPSLHSTTVPVKSESAEKSKVKVKREVNASESEGSVFDSDKYEMVKKAITFKRHRIIAGRDSVTDKESVEALLTAASKLDHDMAHVLLGVKTRYGGFLWKTMENAECQLKFNSRDEIEKELNKVFAENKVVPRIETEVQPQNENIIKTRLFLNEVLFIVKRCKNREKEPEEDGEVKSPNSDDSLTPEALNLKNANKRIKDMYVACILRCLKTVYIKIEPDPGVNVEHRLLVSNDPLSLPGAIRFDALCEPKMLKEIVSWDTIQQMMELRMPKVWVQQEKKKDDDFASEFSFGRYRGDTSGAPTGDITSRMLRLQDCRTRDEYYTDDRRSGSDAGSSNGERGRGVKRERPSPSVKGERRSPSSVKAERRSPSTVGTSSRRSPPRRRSKERDDRSRVKQEKDRGRNDSPSSDRRQRGSIGSGSPDVRNSSSVASVKREKESSRQSSFSRESRREEKRGGRGDRNDRIRASTSRHEGQDENGRKERMSGSGETHLPLSSAVPRSPSTPPSQSHRPRSPCTPPPSFRRSPSTPPPPPPSSSRKKERRESIGTSFSPPHDAVAQVPSTSIHAAVAAEINAKKEALEREKNKTLFPKVVDFDATLVPELEKCRKRLGHNDYQKVVSEIEKKHRIYTLAVKDPRKSEEELMPFRQRLENPIDWFQKALKNKASEHNVPKAAAPPSATPPSSRQPPALAAATTSTSYSSATRSPSEEERLLFPALVPVDLNSVPTILALFQNLRSSFDRIKEDVERALQQETKLQNDPTVQECIKCVGPTIKCPRKHPYRLRRPLDFYIEVLRSAEKGKKESTPAKSSKDLSEAKDSSKKRKMDGPSESKRRKHSD